MQIGSQTLTGLRFMVDVEREDSIAIVITKACKIANSTLGHESFFADNAAILGGQKVTYTRSLDYTHNADKLFFDYFPNAPMLNHFKIITPPKSDDCDSRCGEDESKVSQN